MKKFICLLMVMLLILTVPTIAFATTDEETTDAWLLWKQLSADANKNFHSQLALNISYEEDTGRIILSGQTGALAQQYLTNLEHYQQQYPNVQHSVRLVVDFQFDDNPWYSEYLIESEEYSSIFSDEYILTTSNSENFAFVLCEVQNYTPSSDINNVLANIIEYQDNIPTVDFSEHTLRVKVKLEFRLICPETALIMSDANEAVSVYHNKQTDVEIPLTDVNVKQAIYNTKDNKLLITLESSAEINSLLLAQHNLHLQVYYGTKDDWSVLSDIPLQYEADSYIMDTPTLQHSDEQPLQLKLCWNDKTANQVSGDTYFHPELKHTPGFETDEEVIHISDNLCPLCKKCKTTANVCLWIWISAGVALAISVISFTVFIIISIRKKQNTNKETTNA